MLELTTDPAQEEEREPLFSVDGQVVTVPVGNFSASFALRYMDMVDKFGQDSGTVFLFEHGLSDGGWDLLKTFPGLTGEHVTQVHQVLLKKALGALEGPKALLKSA